MPSGPRIRHNNVFGVTIDNPLTAGAVSFNSLGLANLPVVASAHAVITLDPIRQFGEPEIVIVTAHTAAATVATITRGAYGTVARSHPVNTSWAHAPIDEDVVEVLTSSTRPSNPYEGQFIFETDTNKLIGYGGVDWAPRDAGGTLGYAQVTANQGPITTLVDLTGLTTTVTVGTGRRIKISSLVRWQNTNANNGMVVQIQEGAVVLMSDSQRKAGSGEPATQYASVVLTPSAGSHTYKLVGQLTGGVGSVTLLAASTYPAYILVEDIGAV